MIMVQTSIRSFIKSRPRLKKIFNEQCIYLQNRPTIPPRDHYRFRREASPNPQNNGHISATMEKAMTGPERRPSYKIDYQHNIWQGKNGEISAGGGAQRLPGHNWEPQIGIQGIYRWKREANPQFSVSPNNIDYQHKILQGENGQLIGGLHAQQFPGQKWGFNARTQGILEHGNNQLSGVMTQPLNGPERRPSFNVDYQRTLWQNQNGRISAGVGADKFPGQNWQPRVGVQGSWNF